MKLIIFGEPISSQSFRFAFRGKKIFKYKDKNKKLAEQNYLYQIKKQLPSNFELLSGPLFVKSILYVFKIPTSIYPKIKKHIFANEKVYKNSKPDIVDNTQKPLFDCMQGVVFFRDSQIVKVGQIEKIYGMNPRIEIEIEKMSEVISI